MRRIIWTALALLVAAFGATNARADAASDRLRMAFYDYDPDLKLAAVVGPAPVLKNESKRQTELRRRNRVEFTSAHDQRVTAILTLPLAGAKPYPAMVLLAGSGGHKDTDYIRLVADMLAGMGCASISIDAQYHGERSRKDRSGDIHLINETTSRDAWVQTVIDLRRAVDFLCSRPEVDKARIGYLGFSQGGMIGATFLGVEPRIRAAVLAVAGGGLADWGAKLGLTASPRMTANAEIVEPTLHIGRFAPRPLLMLSAKRDELIPASATEALYAAAGEPKKLIWYNAGHILTPSALVVDARQFILREVIGGPAAR
jgi:dienelactone hydrolase